MIPVQDESVDTNQSPSVHGHMAHPVQPRCVCGSQDKVAREVVDANGVWRPNIQHGNGVRERITCPSCGSRFIRTTGIRPTRAQLTSWGNP